MLGMLGVNFICLIVLIYASYHEWGKMRVIVKTLTSICFLLLGLFAYKENPGGYGQYMLVGLSFGAIGDILLGISDMKEVKQNKWFIGGGVAFSLGHMMFLINFISHLDKFNMGLFVVPIGITFIVWLVTGNRYFQFRGYKSYILGYTFIIGTMLSSAIYMALSSGVSQMKIVTVLWGAGLFVLSDMVLGIKNFYYKDFKWLIALNLSTYYIGQMLLAMSIMY